MRTTALTALALALPSALGIAAGPALAQETTPPPSDRLFAADLAGSQENPPVSTSGTGTSYLRYSAADDVLEAVVATQDLTSVTMAHIHLGAAGTNGPVVASLFGTVTGGVTRDGQLSRRTLGDDDVSTAAGVPTFDGTVESLVTELAAGRAYVNVHTVANPGGEVRGQVAELPDAADFADAGGSAFADEIDAIASAGIARGTTTTTFAPFASITRAQAALFLDRALSLPPTETDAFGDDDGLEAEGAINRLSVAGIVNGTSATAFTPGGTITRGQLASLIARALQLTEGAGLGLFADGGATHGDAIDALFVAGIANGTAPGTFGTGSSIQRGQAAALIARALGLVETAPPVETTLTLLHNNDGESRVLPTGTGSAIVGGAAQFVTAVDQLRDEAEAETDGSILVSAGDNILPGPAFTASQENGTFYDAILLERLGYDAIAPANHDFDFGPQVLRDFLDAFTVPPTYVTTTLDVSGEPALADLQDEVLVPSTVVDVGGNLVGILSDITPDLPLLTSPGGAVAATDVAGVLQDEIDLLKDAGVDTIVVLSTLQGLAQERALIPNLSGVDIVVSGGGSELLADPGATLLPGEAAPFSSYPLEVVNRDGAEVPVVTTTGAYRYLGKLVADLGPAGNFVAEGEGSGPVPITGFTPDAAIASSVEAPVKAFVDALATQVVADQQVPLDGITNNVRSRETNLGNLLADAYVQQVGVQAPDIETPIVGLQNGGGIRNNTVLAADELTRAETFAVAPFGNLLAVTEDVSPAQLLAVLEHSVRLTPNGAGANAGGQFGQWSGLRFTYGPALPQGQKIISAQLEDGTPLVVAGEPAVGAPNVAIALLNFTGRGGDGYPLGNAFGLPFRPLDGTERAAFEAYLTAPTAEGGLGSVITAEDYPEGGEGRIVPVA